MRLVSLAGKEVAAFDQQQIQNNAFFIGALPPGMYVLQTQTQLRLYESKISIE
jgi:hypothetical protein